MPWRVRCLPAGGRKSSRKSGKTGFAWESAQGSLDKLEEETSELRAAVASQQNVEEELGDVLFAAVNAAACLEIDPEMALHAACENSSAASARWSRPRVRGAHDSTS